MRAFGVCPRCAEIFPAAHSCPNCDGDEEAARQVAAARTVPLATISESATHVPDEAATYRQWKPIAAVVGLSVLLS
ncbi:MAG: hypothetical protein V2A73_18880, partial [Pseudomonadota bacterium]